MKKTITGIVILAALLFSAVCSSLPVGAESTPTAPMFYGTQQIIENGSQRIRFISLVHSLKGKYVGYRIEVSYKSADAVKTAIYTEAELQCNTLLSGIVADGVTYQANELGAKKGILAISINNIPTNLGDVYFKVTPYVQYGGKYIYGESRCVQYTNTVCMGAVTEPSWEVDSRDVSVMSFNVLNAWDTETNLYYTTAKDRAKTTAALILEHSPDFVCLQEFDHYYRMLSQDVWTSGDFGAKYGEVTIGDGSTQSTVWNPIFYDKSEYSVVGSGICDFTDCGLSSTEYDAYDYDPSDDVEGDSQFRSLVWVVLENTLDGNRYIVTNMHLSMETAQQTEEAAFVVERLQALSDQYRCPLIACGDYNSKLSGAACNALLNNGCYDTWSFAVEKDDVGTTHTCYNKDQNASALPDGTYSTAIDHIFTLSKLTVTSYDVITEGTYNEMSVLDISDHCPTVVHIYADTQKITNIGEAEGDEPGTPWKDN